MLINDGLTKAGQDMKGPIKRGVQLEVQLPGRGNFEFWTH